MFPFDKYPFGDVSTMIRAVLKMEKTFGNNSVGFSRSSHRTYTQADPDCWQAPLPMSPTHKWPSGCCAPAFEWRKVMPKVDQAYFSSSEIVYIETVTSSSPWGFSEQLREGTRRRRAKVTCQGTTKWTPGGSDALRTSVRHGYANPYARWAGTWINVPFILGSLPSDVDNYLGADCCDLLVAAHNKGHPGHTIRYTYADALAKSTAWTREGVEGTEGDLIFRDFHGPNEEGPPDGVRDHSMICAGGQNAIWASARWWSRYQQTGTMQRCVIADDYTRWSDFIDSLPGWGPVAAPLWRRFR